MRNRNKLFQLFASGVLLFFLLSTRAGTSSTAVSAASVATPVLSSQTSSHGDHQPSTLVEPLVDGATNPELIPNDAALRSLFLAIMLPSNPDKDQLDTLRLKVGRMNLSESDMDILVRELGNFYRLAEWQISQIKARRDTAKISANAATFSCVQARRQQTERFG